MEEDLEMDELFFEDGDLTWNVVAETMRVEQDAYNTKLGKGKKNYCIYSWFKFKIKVKKKKHHPLF